MEELIKAEINLGNIQQSDKDMLASALLFLGYERYKDYLLTWFGPGYVAPSNYLKIINDAMLRDSRIKELLVEYLI